MVRAALVLTLLAASTAAAKGWPTPAAGSSSSGDPEIVFTFDDGPHPIWTPKVLDILAEHQIKAVFFLVGEMVASENKHVPAIVERMVRDGHVIANHTMTHANLCELATDASREIDDGEATIVRIAHVEPVWFRTPYGSRCDRLEGQLAERGLSHFHWDLDPQEWRHGNAKAVVRYVTWRLARASGRNVLLLHDTHAATVRALPGILSWIEQENARRKAAGKRPIRIVQAPELALEQMASGLATWANEATAGARSLPETLAEMLP